MTADTWSAPAADDALPVRYRELLRIDPLSAGALAGTIYGGLGLLGATLFFSMRAAFELPMWGQMVGMVLALPFLYALLGLICGTLAAFFYNLVASTVGGLQMECRGL